MVAAENLSVQFFDAAARFQDSVAFQIKRDGRYLPWSYGEVADQAHRLATFLRQIQISPGDRVALLAENRPEWCVAYLGIVAAGATAVPLDVQLGGQELENLLHHSESRVIVVSEAELGKVQPIIARLPSRPQVILLDEKAPTGAHTLAEILQSSPKGPLPPVPSESTASILYTSGTTGSPKGVILTHRNLVANSSGVRALGFCGPEDNLLALLPLHHVYAFMITFVTPLLTGARVTFLQSLKPPDLLQCMRETGVSILVGVPQLLTLLHRGIFQEVQKRPRPLRLLFGLLLGLAGAVQAYLQRNPGPLLFPQIHRRFGGRLRLISSGGAKLDPAVGRDLHRLGFPVLEGYGLTETSPVVTFNPPQKPRFRSVGVPLPDVQVRIMDPGPDGVGEIAIQGPNVMQCYFKDPKETAKSFRDGWFLSGDLGYLDAEGYLYITGRRKEVIVLSTGKNIYPEEVEAHFRKSPYI
ncbi:MAG: AMP-dependent synthetase/ligase, partial [Candidatus Methylomirabilales bacterium]